MICQVCSYQYDPVLLNGGDRGLCPMCEREMAIIEEEEKKEEEEEKEDEFFEYAR